mmetsp:Transcript_8284/g.20904  ORF Transcript_8284/g.20904 Transcript_8284/m.20904 type:complete len:339 (-) Transcript_8284:3154-4170(-)
MATLVNLINSLVPKASASWMNCDGTSPRTCCAPRAAVRTRFWTALPASSAIAALTTLRMIAGVRQGRMAASLMPPGSRSPSQCNLGVLCRRRRFLPHRTQRWMQQPRDQCRFPLLFHRPRSLRRQRRPLDRRRTKFQKASLPTQLVLPPQGPCGRRNSSAHRHTLRRSAGQRDPQCWVETLVGIMVVRARRPQWGTVIFDHVVPPHRFLQAAGNKTTVAGTATAAIARTVVSQRIVHGTIPWSRKRRRSSVAFRTAMWPSVSRKGSLQRSSATPSSCIRRRRTSSWNSLLASRAATSDLPCTIPRTRLTTLSSRTTSTPAGTRSGFTLRCEMALRDLL